MRLFNVFVNRELISVCNVIIMLIHNNSRILVLLMRFRLNNYLLCFNFKSFGIILFCLFVAVFVVAHEAYKQDSYDYDGST